MPKLWLLFLAVYAASVRSHQERFQEEDEFQATIKKAEEAAESGNGKMPVHYPVSSQWISKNAARYLSAKLRDDRHEGDKTKFFNHLDANSDNKITPAEMETVQAHAAELAAEVDNGKSFFKLIHNQVHKNLYDFTKGVHGEMFAHHDKDGDGKITHEEFQEDFHEDL